MSFITRLNRPTRTQLAVLLICTATNAAISDVWANETELAAKLIDTTGVAPHLAEASTVIFNDALPEYSQCYTSKNEVMSVDDETRFKALIEEHFGTTVALPRAVSVLNDAMNPEDLTLVDTFFKSPVGRRIVEAEYGSKNFDEETFNELMNTHLNSNGWDRKRFKLIEAVYDATRAARFISTLNGELMVATTLSAHCNTAAEDLERLQPQLDSLRTESRFIEPIMRGELIPVVATVFRNLPNSDLEAYANFAESELGVRFFDALVLATGSGLSEGVLNLRQSLTQ